MDRGMATTAATPSPLHVSVSALDKCFVSEGEYSYDSYRDATVEPFDSSGSKPHRFSDSKSASFASEGASFVSEGASCCANAIDTVC